MHRKILPAVLALLVCGCNPFAVETNDQQLTRLRGEREALTRAVVKDVKILHHAQLHYTSSRRRLRGPVLERQRAPMYALHARIEAAKEKAVELEQRIAMLEGEQDVVTGDAPAQ